MTHPESEDDERATHLRGENAGDPPDEPSVQDPELAAESAQASGAGG